MNSTAKREAACENKYVCARRSACHKALTAISIFGEISRSMLHIVNHSTHIVCNDAMKVVADLN